MKKTFILILVFAMIFASVQVVYAFDNTMQPKENANDVYISNSKGYTALSLPIRLYLNDEKLVFDVNPIIKNGRTLVPMRKIFESLGCVVTWDEPTQSISAKREGMIVNLTINSTTMFVNGEPIGLDVAPCLVDSRVLVPVRAISEVFDYKVDWVPASRSVKIYADTQYPVNKQALTSTEIAEKAAPAVFYLEVYDEEGYKSNSGSGFFIDADGIAVTNYHVIDGSYSAYITTTTGGVFNVEKIISYDESEDIAIIKVSKENLYGKSVSGFSTLSIANSDNIKAGQVVYAIGSPGGYKNVISNGIISNVNQLVDYEQYIQITASVSPGSSGGALVNEYGEVLGITSAYVPSVVNMGLVIPINKLESYDIYDSGLTYSQFVKSSVWYSIFPGIYQLHPNEQKEYGVVFGGDVYNNMDLTVKSSDENVVTCEIFRRPTGSTHTLTVTSKNLGKARISIYSGEDQIGRSFTIEVCEQTIEDIL